MNRSCPRAVKQMITVVFVCTGNTCRSPMAQVLLQNMLAEHGGRFQVLSAGTAADNGDAAAPSAIEVMHRAGLHLHEHRSTRLSYRLVEQADVLLTMTDAHKQYIVQYYPEAKFKTFTLKQYAGGAGDVRDPFGADVAAYEDTASELQHLLKIVADNLLQTYKSRSTES